MKKRALISVFDKTGVEDLAAFLESQDVEIISTGGTYTYLAEKGINVIDVSQVTHFPEMLDGRVKTLHPNIHGGILAKRENLAHMETIQAHDIFPIDFVVVNLYPFFEEVQTNKTFEQKLEFIDIGGPTMLRSAAKAFQDVVVICDPEDYQVVIDEMATDGILLSTRKRLAGKVFNLTASYDAAISTFLLGEESMPPYIHASFVKKADLRYGENPHQRAAFYVSTINQGAMKDFQQLQGKELSFNNIRDMDLAWKVVNEFDTVACCAVKHATPCGVAVASTIEEAYQKAHDCDPISIFGGIVACNREVDEKSALLMNQIFLEIVIAPHFTKEALEVFKQKKNLRVITCQNSQNTDRVEFAPVAGGMLVQTTDNNADEAFDVVTKVQPTETEIADMKLGMKVVKYVKSNAIVVVKDGMAKGIGAGQTNRIWATLQALEHAGDGTVLASDAFFPFRDCVDEAAKKGIKAIIQPGGSMRDQESIDAADEHGIAMVLTNVRHFKH